MRSRLLPLLVVPALALAACTASGSADDALRVVASTDVYGDIAATVGGDRVEVTSIIDSSAKDPHSYEASARDRLAVSRADLVIVNGGGYDPFMEQLLEADDSDAEELTAVEVGGLVPGAHLDDHDDETEDEAAHEDEHGEADAHGHLEGVNEHVWYHLALVQALAGEIADELAELDPDGAAAYRANAAGFASDVAALEQRVLALADRTAGLGVAITEPVPLYLLEDAGLANATPEEFSEAIEEGTDVPPLVLQQTLTLVSDGSVVLLAYNEQTAGAETERVRAAAEDAGVPVVDFAETLPDGQDFLGWMTDNVDRLEAALPA